MKFTGTLVAPQIDLQKYTRILSDELLDRLSYAAFEWLDATAATIPQWSGASAATFLHLAREIGYSLSIDQAPGAPNRISRGLRESKGEFTIERDQGRVSFTYSTTLAHLIYNEFNNANLHPDPTLFFRLINPGPYRFQERGRAAFQRVAASVRLPNPFKSLKITRIRVR
jgi:hypothetical protein